MILFYTVTVFSFGEVPFLFQYDNTHTHKARSINKCFFSQIDVEELDRPAQSSDLQHLQHLWDEPELQCLSVGPH